MYGTNHPINVANTVDSVVSRLASYNNKDYSVVDDSRDDIDLELSTKNDSDDPKHEVTFGRHSNDHAIERNQHHDPKSGQLWYYYTC